MLCLVEFVTVDLMGAEHNQPPFLAKNPKGNVPALEQGDGTYLAELTPIVDDLSHLSDNFVLIGSDDLVGGHPYDAKAHRMRIALRGGALVPLRRRSGQPRHRPFSSCPTGGAAENSGKTRSRKAMVCRPISRIKTLPLPDSARVARTLNTPHATSCL